MSRKKLDLTIIVVSFRSRNKVTKLISKIKKNNKIIIVENSNDRFIKKKFSRDKGINIYFPNKNNGFGAGLNYGVYKAKTKYILYLDIDTQINYSQINKLYSQAKKTKNFGVITAKIKGQNYKDLILGKDKNNEMKFVKFNTGCVMMFDKNLFLRLGGFDEKFFLYFEEADFYQRCININKKIFLFEKITVEHEGKGAIDKIHKTKYEILRNWHYCWSKFNYYYKHKGYFTAFSKTFPNLVNSLKGMFCSIIKSNNFKFKSHKAEFLGILAAYLRFKSFYRID